MTPAIAPNSKHIKGTVVARREITDELWSIRVRPAEKLSFQPGQYVTLGLPGSEKMIERPYSLASSPREPELELFLELVPQGQLTPPLHKVGEGGEVFLRRACKGRFLFDQASGHRNHYLVATVTGVAPYVSMVRDMAAREAGGESIPYRVVILHSASFSREFGYYEELSALAGQHSWFTYIPSISRTWLEPEWKGEVGRAEDVARKHLDTLGFTAADTSIYACGNPDMIENVKGVMRRTGFAKEAIKEEVYWVPEKEK